MEKEYPQTFFVLDSARNPWKLFCAHLGFLTKAPKRWMGTVKLAWDTCPPGIRAGIWQFFYFAEAGVLAQYLARRRVQHLHNHLGDASGTVALLASNILDIPFSFTAHGPDLFFEAKKWSIDVKVEKAKFVACISHFCRSQLMIFSDPQYWDKLAIVRCGIEPTRYTGSTKPIPEKRVLFIGRLAAVKGVSILLEAFSRIRVDHPTSKLILVGDGPERSRLEEQAKGFGLIGDVEFAGYLSQNEVARQLEATDILVLPSFAEGLPVVLMEALASSKPVITTSVAGIPELICDGKTGLLIPPGDLKSLEKALDQLLSDPELCVRLGEAGRDVVYKLHNIECEAQKLLRLFAE